ncbi:hypothetical protein [Dokdonella immobilis]|uniref:TubC N-terminal docking domain-containing protein n=1 Tax=Dokdonella immobilis TaxID=578942 RepID=A0A1I4ZUV7_9GAMM|nr:hypothetical protein [Dokdonella immobilis]SFN53843.1 hypothetical protein SAMN05216289_12912 [Dokdonella immobilis]
MNAVDSLLADLQQHHVRIERRGDRIHMRAPRRPPDDLRARVRELKPALLAVLPDARVVRTVVKYRLRGGCPRSWCTAIGTRTREEVIEELHRLHGPTVEVLP